MFFTHFHMLYPLFPEDFRIGRNLNFSLVLLASHTDLHYNPCRNVCPTYVWALWVTGNARPQTIHRLKALIRRKYLLILNRKFPLPPTMGSCSPHRKFKKGKSSAGFHSLNPRRLREWGKKKMHLSPHCILPFRASTTLLQTSVTLLVSHLRWICNDE